MENSIKKGSIVWARVSSIEKKGFIACTTEEDSSTDKATVELQDGQIVEGKNLLLLVEPVEGKSFQDLFNENQEVIIVKLMKIINSLLPDLDELMFLRMGISMGK